MPRGMSQFELPEHWTRCSCREHQCHTDSQSQVRPNKESLVVQNHRRTDSLLLKSPSLTIFNHPRNPHLIFTH